MRKIPENDVVVEQAEFKDTVFAKCKNCGGNMAFDPSTQQLKCLFCATVREFEKNSSVKELDFESAISSDDAWSNESTSHKCVGCGAVLILTHTETAKTCPYCGIAHVIKSEELLGLRPNAVYPFIKTKKEAIESVKKWANKKLFIKSSFKKSLKPENFYGVYEPCYTYDSQTFSRYDGVIGINRTRVTGSGKKRRVYTYTEWRRIGGTHTEFFDDVMIESSDDLTQKELHKLMPFDNSTIKEFDQSYLNGFMAHRSCCSVKDGWDVAKQLIDGNLKKNILSQYHYHIVQYLNVDTTHNAVTYKYVLLPIYHLIFKHKKKTYKVYANGNSNKVVGKYPVSPLKVAIATILGLCALFFIGWLLF